MSKVRRLVVNADDLGLSQGVNRGILEAHMAGAVTSASIMVNGPAFADAVELARSARGLGVGLHLNLTKGRPVSPRAEAQTLVDPRTGCFYPLSRLAARALAGRVAEADVATECAAQIEKATRAGLALTHLDAHHHAHVLPRIWRPVLDAARRAGIRVVRVPLEPTARMIAWSPTRAIAQGLLAASHRLAAAGSPLPLRRADQFRGFALTARPDFLRRLLSVVDRLRPGVTELMVHPGYADEALTGWAAYTAGREIELAALISDAFSSRLRRADVTLVHFGDV